MSLGLLIVCQGVASSLAAWVPKLVPAWDSLDKFVRNVPELKSARPSTVASCMACEIVKLAVEVFLQAESSTMLKAQGL